MNPLNSFQKFKILVRLSVILFCNPFNIQAQTSSPDSAFQKQFNTFNTSIKQDFNTFRQNNDSLFLQFLTQSWKEFNAVKNEIPSPPKPIEPPTYKAPDTTIVPKADTVLHESPELHKVVPLPENNNSDIIELPKSIPQEVPKEDESFSVKPEAVPEPGAMSSTVQLTKIAYCGTDFSIPSATQEIPVLSVITKQGIAKYFAAASHSSELNAAAAGLKKEADECRLNDWGLANLFMKAAQQMYPHSTDQVMFTWFALLHSGFNVKIGYNEKNVYLLLPSNEVLYEMSFTVNGRQYYLLNFGIAQAEPAHLSIHEANYPQSASGLSFKITQTPQLSNLFSKKTLSLNKPLELKLNKNLIDFYSIYPQCELSVFFRAPLSANAISQLDRYFLPTLENKKDDDRVAFLLKFVQDAIPYKTDAQQFGHEKYLFADETLYYPAADCEDRAIFLAKLINRYTSCKVIGLSYPTHVSLAVNLTSLQYGKFLTYKNLKYFHCDPTYLGAGCGIPMPDFENVIPKIIDYNL
jgi:hypothetical protein